MTPANSTITSNPWVKRLEFLDGGTSAFTGLDDRFVGTLISALGQVVAPFLRAGNLA